MPDESAPPAGAAAAPVGTPAGAPARPRPAAARVTTVPPLGGRALEPRVRGAAPLRFLGGAFLHLDRWIGRLVPDRLNPFLHTGAVATTALLVATVTGVLELFWYRPSLHQAYPSVAAMAAHPWTAGLIRSLHRYSADLAMGFALLHALRMLFERRFAGARWLAWVTGVAAVGLLGFVGWTGYWLVWDTRGHAVAVGTARVLDVLPIFADPMGRSFLTDRSLNSLLFFVVFFLHMLVPLAAGIALWLHIVRLARPRWVTRRPLTLWTAAALVALAAAVPADTAAPARMTEIRQAYPIDAWYLAPIALTDRMGGGGLWAVLLGTGLVAGAVPWALGRRRKGAAHINTPVCTACTQCTQDCPYHAITMIPRNDGSTRHSEQAEVDPGLCVDCGICASSCDSIGTDLSWFSMRAVRERIEGWVRAARMAGDEPVVVLACAQAAGGDLYVDPASGRTAALPGAILHQAPCAGWVHAMTVERALRAGAKRALIVGCGPGCAYREGHEWMRQHLDGERDPTLRTDKVPRERVDVLEYDRTRRRDLARAVVLAREGRVPAFAGPRPTLVAAGTALLALLVAGVVGAVSVVGYASPPLPGSELVVTFKHPGAVSEEFRVLTAEEQARIPPHMRRDRVYRRGRADVRMRVAVDGRVRVDRAYPPKGIWRDGNSMAVEVIPVSLGTHRVTVAIGDTREPGEWRYRTDETLGFTGAARRVIAFDRVDGFTVH